jgi:hypothetical protein
LLDWKLKNLNEGERVIEQKMDKCEDWKIIKRWKWVHLLDVKITEYWYLFEWKQINDFN